MKYLQTYKIFENAEPIKAMSWDEYCEDIFYASSKEVEAALDGEFDEEEIEEFKKAKYYVLGRVISPDMNKRAVKNLDKEAKKLKPAGTTMLDSEEFFDKAGTLVYAAVACDGDGLAPCSLDLD